jgi:hypothetical protein
MIETKDIKKMVAHIIRRDKGIADTTIMHPAREWYLGLGLASLIVCFGSWFCWYLFSSHKLEMQKEIVVIEQAVPYQAATVKSALELFAIKQKKYDEILGTKDIAASSEAPSIATSTDSAVVSEEVSATPEVIIDPASIFEDDGTPIEAVLAP